MKYTIYGTEYTLKRIREACEGSKIKVGNILGRCNGNTHIVFDDDETGNCRSKIEEILFKRPHWGVNIKEGEPD